MNVSCPQCKTVFRVDPRKVPADGVRARCSVCGGVFEVVSEKRQPAVAATAAPPAAEIPAAESAQPSVVPAAPAPAPPPADAEPDVEVLTPLSDEDFELPEPATVKPYGAETFDPLDDEGIPTPETGSTEVVEVEPEPLSEPQPAPLGEEVAKVPIEPAQPVAEESELVARPEPEEAEAVAEIAESVPAPAEPPVAEPAPPPEPVVPETPPEPEPALASPTPEAAAPPAAPAVSPFGQEDQDARARRFARALISDLAAYNPDRQEKGLQEGRLKELFQDELRKSWQEYVDQVGLEVAKSTPYFRDALNDILAKGKNVF